jgi:hypothetical protein
MERRRMLLPFAAPPLPASMSATGSAVDQDRPLKAVVPVGWPPLAEVLDKVVSKESARRISAEKRPSPDVSRK